LERGRVTAANVVDHVVPHKGDWTAFCTGKLQSLCEPCHSSTKRQIELRGYRYDIGLDGFPTDPIHPFNRAGGMAVEDAYVLAVCLRSPDTVGSALDRYITVPASVHLGNDVKNLGRPR
jgi:hypothetical protein